MQDKAFQAIIFDMDGVLIDSEPLWRKAEIKCALQQGLAMTEEICDQTQGMRIDQVMQYWAEQFPLVEFDHSTLQNEVVKEVIQLIQLEGELISGVADVLAYLQKLPVKVALASSSLQIIIDAVVDQFGIRHFFDAIHSAEYESYGKPHPDVYLSAAKKIAIAPENCVAIEDSLSGVQSAKNAGMFVIATNCTDKVADNAHGYSGQMESLLPLLTSMTK
ncbi:MAG: hexitol phosphatase HxpB [bacterium]